MPRVLLTTCCPAWPYERQTPGRSGRWEDFEFVIQREGEVSFDQADLDAWVVFDNPLTPVTAKCCPENLFFLSWEPPEIRSYGNLFLNQFRWVQTCHDVSHPGLIRLHQAQPWHVGVNADNGSQASLDYDDFASMTPPPKTHLISAAISSKAITPAHRQRLEFAHRLKDRLGDQFHLLGRGHQPFSDKWDAVSPYRFHLVLENSTHPDYITEKLSDAFLGNAFPFYFGAPNASDHFPTGSFQPIDIFQPEQAIEIVCQGIADNLDQQRQTELAEARRVVLDEFNLFPMLVKLLRAKMQSGTSRMQTIYPKNQRGKLVLSGVRSGLHRAFRSAA